MISPGCRNTILRPSVLPHLTHHLLSSAATERAPQSPVCSQWASSPSWSAKAESWRKAARSTWGVPHLLSQLESPCVQEQNRRKSPLSLPQSRVCPLHPVWLPMPRLWEKPGSAWCMDTKLFSCHRNTGHVGDIPTAECSLGQMEQGLDENNSLSLVKEIVFY